jgi:hypothetical protein
MSNRATSLPYLFALTALHRSAIVPQPTVEGIAALLRHGMERRIKGQGK